MHRLCVSEEERKEKLEILPVEKKVRDSKRKMGRKEATVSGRE